MPRLLALGVVLMKLFSAEGPPPGDDAPALDHFDAPSMDLVVLEDEPRPVRRPQKRPQRPPRHAGGKASHCISRLERRGVPWSLCSLTLNLLDCGNGDLSGDEAYSSLADLRADLRLMVEDPSRFLHDVESVPMPTLDVCDKLYGREGDVTRLEQTYRQHVAGQCSGVLVSGGAGVGKSRLVAHVLRKLAGQSNGCLLAAKFDQNNEVKPLSAIGNMFNSLCDLFVQDATPAQLELVEKALESNLGSQAGLLAGIVPSLSKLLPSCAGPETSINCVDAALSVRFQFGELLSAISSHSSRPVSLFFDDIQWADAASLLLVGNLMYRTEGSNMAVFFAFCHRDDDAKENGPFNSWLSSALMYSLEVIKIENIAVEGVNELMSDALRLSPRITRPLASVLHHKTRGNPLFLRRLVDSLEEQGYIRFQMRPPRWAWDLEKIADMKISDDVLALLIKEMKRLPAELQLGLKVASCIGSCISCFILDILSKDLNVNLAGILQQASNRGFMDYVEGDKFCFAHDKIQQAAYELMTEHMRGESHTRFGLALCASGSLNNKNKNDDLLFTAANQVNLGGVARVRHEIGRNVVAELNLKAGKRAIDLTDYGVAFQLFEHGISFLDTYNCWASQYNLSLELSNAAIESACALNDVASVRRLSEQVLTHAKCDDDKLNCLYTTAKSLRLANELEDSKRVAFATLKQLGERLPRSSDGAGISADIQEMKMTLTSLSDDDILNMMETNEKKRDNLLVNLYHDINFLFGHMMDTGGFADSSLRMVQITLSNGLCISSPLGFADFAVVLVTMGDTVLGYRMSTLALRLLDTINAYRYTSAVIGIVGSLVSWVAEPMHSIAETHLLGYKYGQRNGDIVSGSLNNQFYLLIIFLSGQSLHTVRDKSREFALELLQRKQQFLLDCSRIIYLQAVSFIEGLELEREEDDQDKFPCWENIIELRSSENLEWLVNASHQYMRSFLFKQYGNLPQHGLLDGITGKKVSLQPILVYGVFFEGLASFHLARQPDRGDCRRKGEAALAFMRHWSTICRWNFENKKLLLEAELMNILGENDQAEFLYTSSVRSAHEHKFIHEEAIASELAATFFHERGLHQKAHTFFVHAVNCFETWGAFAIARRVENNIRVKFGSCYETMDEDLLASFLAPTEVLSKKHAQ